MNRGDPLDLELLQRERKAAEIRGDDRELIRLRELERACAELPSSIEGARLSGLICGDAISTTWTAWRPETGERLLIRCLHTRWRRDPVLLRQLQRDLALPEHPSLHVGSSRVDGDHAYNQLVLGGPRLREILPMDGTDEGDPLIMSQVLAGGLSGLGALHREGLAHGPELVAHLFFNSGLMGLAWLGRFGEGQPAASDISTLARASLELSTHGLQPIRQLAESWVQDPPSRADDAGLLLQRAMASTLLDARHRIWMAHRHMHRRTRISRLAVAVRQLQQVLPPPVGRVCLRAQRDGQLVIAHGDGQGLFGQAISDPQSTELKPVFRPGQALNPVASRFLLRAWAMRHRGDEERRAGVQAELGSSDSEAEAMMRWLSGMTRLRSAGLLLRAEDQIRERASERALNRPL